MPTAILDGGPITALRTAAVSGVAIRHFAPTVTGRAPRAALIGAGVQGRSHLAVLGGLLPAVSLTLFDRHPERAAALADAARETDGIGEVTVAPDARSAVRDADVVITAASFGPIRQVMTPDWLAPDALVVPVDYATYCAAAVAETAALFLVDDRGQFLANRDSGLFDGVSGPDRDPGRSAARRDHAAACRTGGGDAPRRRAGRRRVRGGHPRAGRGARARGRPAALTARDARASRSR